MNEVALKIFSYFDTGSNPSKVQPERFYHGFVLGLLVDLKGRYHMTSNRESGFGRYDIMLEPVKPEQRNMIQSDAAVVMKNFSIKCDRCKKNMVIMKDIEHILLSG